MVSTRALSKCRMIVVWAVGWVALTAAPASALDIDILHGFTGALVDGRLPNSGLTISGSTLFGVTLGGGVTGGGTIYKINTDGSGYQRIHEFTPIVDGDSPWGALIVDDAILYGTTSGFGTFPTGTVFKINTDGSGHQILHQFAGGVNDGSQPITALTLHKRTLYGTTHEGGDDGIGTVFKVNTNGLEYQVLHEFAGGVNDGDRPQGEMTLVGNTLYGTTINGGDADFGTIFKINIDGTGFQPLHVFTEADDKGRYPTAGLFLDGNTLYGTTNGGANEIGTVYQLQTDGSGYQLLHEFTGSTDGGASPEAPVLLIGHTLYGTTLRGGVADEGIVYSLVIPEPSTFALAALRAVGHESDRQTSEVSLTHRESRYALPR